MNSKCLLVPCLAFLAACAARKPDSQAAEAARRAADEERIRLAAESWLHAQFPEVQGALTRESIARVLFDTSEAAGASLSDVQVQAIAAIQRGDFEGARGKLGALVAGAEVARAEELLAHADPRGALSMLDRAVAIAPESADLLCLRGEAALQVGEHGGGHDFFQSALDDFLNAAGKRSSARAWLGASRAARRLGLPDRALEYARTGVAELSEREALAGLPVVPERTLAEAGFDAWQHARGANAAGAEAGAEEEAAILEQARRARECQGLLEDLIGREPEDVSAWRDLAGLHLQIGENTTARAVALHGLRFEPADPELHATLSAAARAMGGREALVATYAEFSRTHSGVALAEWYPADARFQQALEALATPGQETGAAPAFEAAEAGFARCAKLDPAYAEDCAARRALCRTGLGWARLASGDLDGARQAFLSTQDAHPAGLDAELPGSGSALRGLLLVGLAYKDKSKVPDTSISIDYVERAARIFDFLSEYQPDDPTSANNSGNANRDAADLLKIRAMMLASRDEIDEANRLLTRARELVEKSYSAYVKAAKLAPDDAGILNDTGMMLVNYLQRDPATAEDYLRRAVKIGEDEVPKLRARADEAGIDEQERRARQLALEEAENVLGNAYQNLGVLELTLKGDAARAKEWLEKSLVTGADPREEVRGESGYLAQAVAALEQKIDPRVNDDTRWAAPVKAHAKNATLPAAAHAPAKQQ